ncbi:hypothetical protein B0H10DRAFT_1969255 [Mycena sp. CBHHK59/15]|nr:hypothetical protein B0H10DRAFT_1969255 [Mycena sp. CBHHK59/15]
MTSRNSDGKQRCTDVTGTGVARRWDGISGDGGGRHFTEEDLASAAVPTTTLMLRRCSLLRSRVGARHLRTTMTLPQTASATALPRSGGHLTARNLKATGTCAPGQQMNYLVDNNIENEPVTLEVRSRHDFALNCDNVGGEGSGDVDPLLRLLVDNALEGRLEVAGTQISQSHGVELGCSRRRKINSASDGESAMGEVGKQWRERNWIKKEMSVSVEDVQCYRPPKIRVSRKL